MPSDTGQGTESYTWDANLEWNEGTFTDTATAGTATLRLGTLSSLDFDYSIIADDNAGTSGDCLAEVEIRDTSSGTVLASDSVTSGVADDTQSSASGTFTIDVGTHEDITFEAHVVTSSNPGSPNEASISGPIDGTNTTIVNVDVDATADQDVTDTQSEVYEYVMSGSWVSEDYTFTEVTTATRLAWTGVTLPNAGDDVTVTVEDETASNTYSESLSAGSGEVLFDIAPDDVYRLDVSMSTATDDTTPVVDSLTLETHTPPTSLAVSSTGESSVDLDWSGVSVADNYQVYRNTSSPVDETGTLAGSPTSTSFSDSGLDSGVTYYYNVRAEYTGE